MNKLKKNKYLFTYTLKKKKRNPITLLYETKLNYKKKADTHDKDIKKNHWNKKKKKKRKTRIVNRNRNEENIISKYQIVRKISISE